MKENTQAFKALFEAQKEIPTIKKDGRNPHFKNDYATCDNIIRVVKPILAKQGLFLMQPSEKSEGFACIRTLVVHAETGEQIDLGTVSVPIDKKNAQGYGSALTYGRRYGLAAGLCLTTGDDDDGNLASKPKPDDIMSIKARVMMLIKSLGFKENEEIRNIVDLARRRVDAAEDVDGWLAVETFLGTLDKNSVMAFLNGDSY